MIQFLNNIWIALCSENAELVNAIAFPVQFIESYLSMQIFLTLFNMKASKKQAILFVLSLFIISRFSSSFLPAPFNVIFNYTGIIICIKLIFQFNFLKCFLSLIASSFTFGIISTLIQNPFMKLLSITPETFINTPIYRFSFLALIYSIIAILLVIFKNFRSINLSLDLFDTLDKYTLRILYANILLGFLTLGSQLVITAFYINIVPLMITLLSSIILVAFLVLSIYSFTRIIKLANTRKNLQSAEEYNKSLQNLYDEVKGFKHDFDNIVSTIDGYIETNDMNGLKEYFYGVKKDCKLTNNLSLLNPSTINNPGIYSLLNNKYFKAINLGITFDIDFFFNLDSLNVNMYQFSRILGILIDNAIEEAEKCENKIVKISFVRENKNNRALITVVNTYSNKDVDIEKIFEKGKSGKENHSGIGLWEVRKYVSKSKNLDLFTSKTNDFFKQELSIYDIT